MGANAIGVGMNALESHVNEAYARFQATQCGDQSDYPEEPTSDGNVPTRAVRLETSQWPLLENETDLNTIGGLCGMPTQFLKTVRVGGRHRVPRFMQIAAESRFHQHTEFQRQRCTDRGRTLYVPLELLSIRSDVSVPRFAALDRFLSIAWDGVGTINSEWDSCEVGCEGLQVMDNRICGGAGLSDFSFPLRPKPTSEPTSEPSLKPTSEPTSKPTLNPTSKPTLNPSDLLSGAGGVGTCAAFVLVAMLSNM